tara:strand:- start:1341 stop:1523 length:183 start_codon:yes stop_codon:yes gene_type:complete
MEKEELQNKIKDLECQCEALRKMWNELYEENECKDKKIKYLLKALKECAKVLGDDYNLDI